MAVKRSVNGFTFLELMITLAIVTLLVGLAVPSMQTWVGQSAIASTTNALVSSIQTARSAAVSQNIEVGVCPSANPEAVDAACGTNIDWTNGWIVFVDNDGDGIRTDATEEVLLQMEKRTPGFTISTDSVFQNLIYFSPNGTSITANDIPVTGQLTIDYGPDESRMITVSANGNVRTTTL